MVKESSSCTVNSTVLISRQGKKSREYQRSSLRKKGDERRKLTNCLSSSSAFSLSVSLPLSLFESSFSISY